MRSLTYGVAAVSISDWRSGDWRRGAMRVRLCAAAVIVVLFFAGGVARRLQPSGTTRDPVWDTGTFSILGYDPATGEIGGAVQSRVFSVGNGVLWADANAGVAATQAIVDVGYGPHAIELLRKNVKPSAIVERILEEDRDPLPEAWSKQGRQFAVMNL